MGNTANGDNTSVKAFVAGATGFTGWEVVRILAQHGVRTISHVRPDSGRMIEWREKFSAMGAEIDSTPWDEAAMTETMKRLKPDMVFALLGTTRARMKQAANAANHDYEAVDYGLTAMLARAAVAAGIKPRFVYLSAMGAQGNNATAYYKARRKAEDAVLASGLSYTIARPSFIVGAGRDDFRPGEKFGAPVIDALLSVVALGDGGRMKAKYASMTNTVLAEALVRLALDPNSANRIAEAPELRQKNQL